ncbi:hypothetical protein CCACVL1_16622 [Corchorus capsularis]|uniref:Uncharacterized protein n=1 Tax=Corchorus capsularis TaxID=210143 RepID=A0A1R3HW12_COCAP|nr:hypothetical protein CCACVL1_16622 [Corchorus capsularis]
MESLEPAKQRSSFGLHTTMHIVVVNIMTRSALCLSL